MDLVGATIGWYDGAARDLPWRAAGTSPWGVLVSEVMLQQTPVARVVPVYLSWLDRWPRPEDLAAESVGAAVRLWGRLGYPRRAVRLHAAAVTIARDHQGQVPREIDALLALPGVGAYTAAAVASFAYGERHVVLDTNVRRLLARVRRGAAQAAATLTAAERADAGDLLPHDATRAARWAVASMELGALVCTARSPRCDVCPVQAGCAWHAAGRPGPAPPRRTQVWAGSDRQARGRLLGVVRESRDPVAAARLRAHWPDTLQRTRALAGLVADGLLERTAAGYVLPGAATRPTERRRPQPRASAASAGT